ncbi:putative dynamin family protein [Phaeomoniella chlamydospora]|uniref:Putative dynamin family protein n=1 Tax=Phaeomoniella chlamydospora TaxID=158046 RepID=A0A0G2EXA2_PHACM|nr:putative dynamin family protein [Phaeomoniella chlamydospora]
MEPNEQSSLQSQEHKGLLDIIDQLRSLGISDYVDLPQVIVCGDQSSGKSSVLEALSGIRFPRKDNLCTRFATEVILRRYPDETTNVSIVCNSKRHENEKVRMQEFFRSNVCLDEFAALVDDAKACMGLENNSRTFSNDILRVEITGPEQPHLTLVDLPGLFSAANKEQSDEDVKAVRGLVRSYMKRERSIILAVVSAQNDFVNQVVTRIRQRTIVSETGREQRRVFPIRLACTSNRDFEARDTTSEERDEAEASYFSKGVWLSLPKSHVGISALKPRLADLLKNQILTELPGLIQDVENGIQDSRKVLEKLGDSRSSLHEQRQYLLRVSLQIFSLVRFAIDGNYGDSFFGDATTESGSAKRLRAVVTNLLRDFEKTLRERGHAKHIVDNITEEEENEERLVLRESYVDEVLQLMTRSRGRELPGTYNPQIIGDLFFAQARPWQTFVERYVHRIWERTMVTLDMILEHSSDHDTAAALRKHLLHPKMLKVKEDLKAQVATILEPHQRGHPITYNHYFTENVQRMRISHRRKVLVQKLDTHFGTDLDAGADMVTSDVDVGTLLSLLMQDTIPDMDRYACSEAIDCMRAYYKVAFKTFVDNVAVLVVEKCLLQKLPELISPSVASELDDHTVSLVAGETETSRIERTQASEKFTVLDKALEYLRSLQQFQPDSGVTTPNTDPELPIEESEDSESEEVSDTEMSDNSV